MVSLIFFDRYSITINGISCVYRNVSASLNDSVKCRSVDHQILYDWKRIGPERLNGDYISVFKCPHVQLTGSCSLPWSVWPSVYHHRAHTTNSFSAIMVECNWITTFGDQAFIEYIDHLKKRHLRRNVLHRIGFKISFRVLVLLAPYF